MDVIYTLIQRIKKLQMKRYIFLNTENGKLKNFRN